MKPLFSLKFTIFLSIVLLTPFFLRNTHPKLEPYPAILLPSGAGKLNLNKEIIEINTLTIYGYDLQGNIHKIDASKFLEPIPVHFIYGIVDNEFGLSKKTIDRIWITGIGQKIWSKRKIDLSKKNLSLKQKELAKLWLSNKLNKLGLSTSLFLIRYEQKNIDIHNGNRVLKKTKYEKYIFLQ